MAIAVTTEAGPACPPGSPNAVPVAALELVEPPGAIRRPTNFHDDLQTTIQVVDGVVYVVADDDEWALTPGDSATIAPGTPYRRWNAGDSDARWVEIFCAS